MCTGLGKIKMERKRERVSKQGRESDLAINSKQRSKQERESEIYVSFRSRFKCFRFKIFNLIIIINAGLGFSHVYLVRPNEEILELHLKFELR